MSDSQDIFQATHNQNMFLSYLKVKKKKKNYKTSLYRLKDFCGHLYAQSFIRLKAFMRGYLQAC